MRGRRIWREPPGSSICAFCAHQLGTAQPASYVPRRYLQSSPSVSRPPATAAAVQEQDDGDAQYYQSPPTPSTSWVNDRQGASTPGIGFGKRPAFGNTGAATGSASSTGWSRSAFGTATLELTEDEKRARELINQSAEKSQPRRVINVYPVPGPESSRAGRPIPIPQAAKLAAERKQKIMELDQQRKEAARSGPTFSKVLVGSLDPTAAKGSQISGRDSGRVATWGQLRRRGEPPIDLSESTQDRFSQGRAQREENARTARYTPLIRKINWNTPEEQEIKPMSNSSSRSIFDGDGNKKIFGSTAATKSPPQSDMERARVYWQSSVRDGPASKLGKGSASRGLDTNISDNSESSCLPSNPRDEEVRKQLELEEERHTKRAAKYTSGETNRPQRLDEIPRGRERDKARRRQRFAQEHEEAAEQAAAAKAELKRQRKLEKAARKAAAPTPIILPEYITVANLAAALKVRIDDFIEKIEELGFEETNRDYVLNGENAGLIAMEYNFEPLIDRAESEDLKPLPAAENMSALPARPPVVTVMGHVDHGKTTLLDWLRKSSVAATEHGGITQHIGAFSVPMPSGKLVTFLDTPGHAAFLSMRQRGANVTDIVILVVAADDSVKPQTIEAISHAKAAKVPIIVAINKIDKEEANVDRVKQDLARHGIEIEDFGGDTQVVSVSGKTGQGMGELEEAVVTLSEILDMRAAQDGQAEGWVLETSIKSMGKVATVLVRRGTMRSGDFIVAGKTWARIRCLRNEARVEIAEAGPGTPVEIDGWKEQPLAGDEVLQAPTESKAKSVIEYRLEKEERDKLAEDMKAINESRMAEQEKREREKTEEALAKAGENITTPPAEAVSNQASGPKQIYFIIKGDVSGSVEAVVDSITSIGTSEVQPHILRSAVGQLSEFDVEHAAAAKGCLVNFNTTIDPSISRLAEAAKVKIIDHNIIYRLVDDVKATLSEHLPPLVTQRVVGEADVAQVFEVTVKGRLHKSVAGCKIRNGAVAKNARVRVLRGGEKIFDGVLESLKNVKKDVLEMRKGSECGMGFDGWNDFQVGDQVQCYEVKEEKRYL